MRSYLTILVRSYFYFSKDKVRPSIAGKYIGLNVLLQTCSILVTAILCLKLTLGLDLSPYWGGILVAAVFLSLALALLVTHHLHVRLYLTDTYIQAFNLKVAHHRNLLGAVLILTSVTIILFGTTVVLLAMFGG
ncbi:MAG: hypothetical protein R2811_16730 [Flavobacteriales bacterium]